MTLEEISSFNFDDCPKFSEFATSKMPLPGVKRRLDEVLNCDIVVTDFRVMKSKHNMNSECLQIQFVSSGDVCIAFTGSSVLMDQMQSASEHIPFKTRIVKIDKYYSFI
ncbi:MAG: hypothetical protein KBS86_01015 [Proteobacteria bacterium]|nr:hypothetical protein [Candidatus Enterousia scatequi]